MSFSLSTFTIEVNGTSAVVFQAKWNKEADEICRSWVEYHRDQLSTKGRFGLDYPPMVKVRVARAPEQAVYYNGDARTEYLGDIKLVYLRDLADV